MAIDDIISEIKKINPYAIVKVELPQNPSGSTWIDVEFDNNEFTIEYRETIGFGLYLIEDIYCSGPSEVFDNVVGLIERINGLFYEYNQL